MAEKKNYGTPDGDTPVQVALSEIDPRVYKNIRSLSDNSKIEGLASDIKAHDLLQNLSGMRQPDGKVGLSCGFRRFEACQRLALEKVFDEYNKSVNINRPTEKGYAHVDGRTQDNGGLDENGLPTKNWRASTLVMMEGREGFKKLGKDWADKFDAALAGYRVNVRLFKYKSSREAMLHNNSENNNRTDPSFLDNLIRFEEMLNADPPMKQKEIAVSMGLTESMMSHFKRCASIVPYLRNLFTEWQGEDGDTAEQVAEIKDKAKVAIDEMERRMALPEDDPCTLMFRHAKDLSYAVAAKDESKRPPVKSVLRILAELVRLDGKGQPTDEASPDSSAFEARMRAIIREGQKAEEEPTPETPTAPAADAGTLPGKEGDAAASTPTAVATTPQPGAPAATPTTASATPGTAEPAAVVGAEVTADDLALMQHVEKNQDQQAAKAKTEAANAIIAESAGEVDLDELIGEVDTAPTDDDLKKLDDGPKVETRVKTISEPIGSKYKQITPDRLEAQAVARLQDVVREDNTIFDQVACLEGAANYFYAIGMDEQYNAITGVAVEFSEQCDTYLKALEEAVAKFADDTTKASVRASRPKTPEINLGTAQ